MVKRQQIKYSLLNGGGKWRCLISSKTWLRGWYLHRPWKRLSSWSQETQRAWCTTTQSLCLFSWRDIMGAVWWKGLFMTLSSAQYNFHIVLQEREHEKRWTNTLRRAKKTWQGWRNCDLEENTLSSLTSTNYTFRGRLRGGGRVVLRGSNGRFSWWSQMKGYYRNGLGDLCFVCCCLMTPCKDKQDYHQFESGISFTDNQQGWTH